MPDYYFHRIVAGLAPDDDEAKDALKRFQINEPVKVKGLVKPRNPAHHRKFWALLGVLSGHSPENYSAAQIKELMKIRMGFVNWVTCPGVNHPVPLPKSIAYDSMDQLAFEQFYNEAINCALLHFMPQGVSREEMDDAVREVVGFG